MNARTRVLTVAAVSALAIGAACVHAWREAGSFANLWATPDQQGERALRRGDFAAAAKLFTDPLRRGEASYRGKLWEQAAAEFGRVDTPVGAFDRGNALVMLGRYDDAIAAYDKALAQRADWAEAKNNRAIAVARKAAKSPPPDASEGTDGKLRPDKIVFDDRPKQAGAKDEQVVDGEPMSDAELQAVWLKRVQTKPADFLRVKFAAQLEQQQKPADSAAKEQPK